MKYIASLRKDRIDLQEYTGESQLQDAYWDEKNQDVTTVIANNKREAEAIAKAKLEGESKSGK